MARLTKPKLFTRRPLRDEVLQLRCCQGGFDQKCRPGRAGPRPGRLPQLCLVEGTTLRLPHAVFLTTLNKLLILKVPCILMPTLSSGAYAVCFAYHALHLKDFYSSSLVQFKCHFYYQVTFFDSSQWSDPPYTPSSVSQHFIYFSILHLLLRLSFIHLFAELAALLSHKEFA